MSAAEETLGVASVTFKPSSNVTSEFRQATERLANASVAKHAADREFEDALSAYAEARGAARSRGLQT